MRRAQARAILTSAGYAGAFLPMAVAITLFVAWENASWYLWRRRSMRAAARSLIEEVLSKKRREGESSAR